MRCFLLGYALLLFGKGTEKAEYWIHEGTMTTRPPRLIQRGKIRLICYRVLCSHLIIMLASSLKLNAS